MVQLFDVGNRVYVQDSQVASLSFTPLPDRAAKVTRIRTVNDDGADTWIVNTGGAEVGRFASGGDGKQLLLGDTDANNPLSRDIFSWYEEVYGQMLMYPVPKGQEFQVSSVGGAKADVLIEYMECSEGDVTAAMVNYPRGKKFCVPYYAFVASGTTETAEQPFNAEIHPQGFPNLFSGTPGQTGYDCFIKAIWPQAGEVTSTNIAYLYALLGADRWFTRAQHGGIPLIDDASALGIDLSPFKQFQNQMDAKNAMIDPPIHIPPGMISQWGFGLSAGAGGTDDLSGILLAALVDVTVMS